MRQLLSLDSKIIQFLNKLFDLVGLNVLFMACCLPIITIPAAWGALLTTKYKQQTFPDLAIYTVFWKLVKEKWITSLKTGSFTLTVFLCLVVLPSRLNITLLLPIQLIGIITTLVLLTYQFILTGLYEMKFKDTLRNCGYLFMSFPIQTSLMIIINTLIVFLSVTSYAGLLIAVYFYLFGGFVGLANLNAWSLRKVLTQLSTD
ncbi:DUF624 domain-containing protein [Fundicoccus sp. Sow4_D5]|uniref:DUF624 domain-containing protein n=1 Tax=Fundicoccus sp. Sow4_D5 TaxID=3438782 RepID=UPI003F8E58AA